MSDPTKTAVKKPAGRMETALTSARGTANDALHETRKAAQRMGKAAEANPLAVLAGGIAIGLAAGALLPRTKRETQVLGSVGKRLNTAAAGAAAAAKDAAKAELGAFPLSKGAARAKVNELLGQVGKAMSAGGDAALAARSEAAKPAKRTRRKAD